MQQHLTLNTRDVFTRYFQSSGSIMVPFEAGYGLSNIYCSLKEFNCLCSADFHVGHSLCLMRIFRVVFIRVYWYVHGTSDLGVN